MKVKIIRSTVIGGKRVEPKVGKNGEVKSITKDVPDSVGRLLISGGKAEAVEKSAAGEK